MMKGIVRFALLASIASTAVISHGAYAQDSAVTAQSAAVPDAGTGDIVVTAQRRSEKQSQVPISLTAFTADSLARTGVNDARTLTQVTPGLNFQSVGSSAQPSIRGIGSTGSSVGDSSNVSMYIDGVYQPFQAANFVRFVDIERIEVLKGPQGTLFGRNAAGGAISITTLSPKLDETTGKFGHQLFALRPNRGQWLSLDPGFRERRGQPLRKLHAQRRLSAGHQPEQEARLSPCMEYTRQDPRAAERYHEDRAQRLL